MSSKRIKRRTFLKSTTAAGVIGVAGCLGSEDESGELRIGTSAGGTQDVGLAVERAVDQESDALEYSTIESPGYVGTIYRLNEDQFDGGITDTNSMTKAQNDLDMFEEDPVDKIPYQGFLAFPYSIYVVARADTDIETFDDLAGANVYPAEPGYSTRATTLDVWRQEPTADVYEAMNIMDMDVSDAPGAMEEGRIDAAIAYGTPNVGHTGWVVEYDARVDVNYVEPTDALVESAEGYAGAGSQTYDVEEFMWEQDIGTDEVFAWNLEVTYAFHPDANEDDVYELCRVVHEHNDTVRDGEERFIPVEDASDLTEAAIDGYPFHPGVAQYLQDNDAWDDAWEVGG